MFSNYFWKNASPLWKSITVARLVPTTRITWTLRKAQSAFLFLENQQCLFFHFSGYFSTRLSAWDVHVLSFFQREDTMSRKAFVPLIGSSKGSCLAGYHVCFLRLDRCVTLDLILLLFRGVYLFLLYFLENTRLE